MLSSFSIKLRITSGVGFLYGSFCIADRLNPITRFYNTYKNIEVIRKLNNNVVHRNYFQIKQDVQDIIQSEIEWLLGNPALRHLIIKK